MDQLERERAENAELRGRMQRLDTQYNAFVSGERELIELNDRLEHDLAELRSEQDRVRDSTARDREQADQLVADSRSAWAEEKCHLQSRVDELDVQLASAVKKLSTATAAYKQVTYFSHYTNTVVKLPKLDCSYVYCHSAFCSILAF